MKIEKIQKNLAQRILDYEKDVDYYEFNNNYNNDDEAFNDILETLRNSDGIEYILTYLNNDIDHYQSINDVDKNDAYVNEVLKNARSIYDEVKKYQDGMINMEYGRW